MEKFGVVIVGGGLIGQSLALALSNFKLEVGLVDLNYGKPVLSESYDNRVSAIVPSTVNFLKAIGIWGNIRRKRSYQSTRVWDQNSNGKLNFSSKNDDLGFIIENNQIIHALHEAIECCSNIKVINSEVKSIVDEKTHYQINLDSSASLNTDLLIGADGFNSSIRKFASISSKDRDYEQHAFVFNIETQEKLDNAIWQRFNSDSISAVLPLDDHIASIVWSVKNDLKDELDVMDQELFLKSFSRSVEHAFGKLKIVSKINSFPLYEMKANEYIKPNLVLIGDAAHRIHPLAGQGANIGFMDIMELINVLEDSNFTNLGNIRSLKKYERRRKFENEMMSNAMTGLDGIFKNTSEFARTLRGLGMNLIDSSDSLKSKILERASGKNSSE
ncbi:MAG: 2-octaprenyl-3-methyl-6-methoxy-1,4-benzoquinol hydroxylase [Gammaproteobacteria bacterium]|jgi:2-octaprenylphenol hydroxylase|nr:2-octaprenyl-3-methyl-6-methoxy-1,4-benzoquinol hydroxylase [Gammaproteobacteria bacterium]